MALELQKGRPADTTGRLDKEIRTYDLLDRLGVEYDRVDHAPAMTMEDCKEVDEILESMVCKNLSGNRVLPADDPGYQGVPYQGSVGTDRLGEAFFCQAGIHGEIPGYHPRLCQCTRSDER